MAADQAQFQQLLNSLLSIDNDVRTQAEVRTSGGGTTSVAGSPGGGESVSFRWWQLFRVCAARQRVFAEEDDFLRFCVTA